MYERLISTMNKAVALDADVQAFLTATGISNATIQTALVNLVAGLKTDGLWTKMYAIYPIVGGTAATHKYNLKDPRDLDAAFRLTYTVSGGGAITHDSTGMQATTSTNSPYADTHLVPSTVIPSNAGSMGAWLTLLATAANWIDMGCRDNGSTIINEVISIWGDTHGYSTMNGATPGATDVFPASGSENLVQVVRSSSTAFYVQNGTNRSSFSGNYNAPTRNIYLMCGQSDTGTPWFSSNRKFKYAYVGQTLTTTEMDNYRTRVATFQSDLGR